MTAPTVNDLDQLLQNMVVARKKHEDAKEVASKFYEERRQAEMALLDQLKNAGKDKWEVDGVGKVITVSSMSIQVPKTVEDKKALWDYVVAKYGEDLAYEKFSMHSKTLQSFYNEEYKAAEDKSLFILPGVEAPTYETDLRYYKP